MCGPPSPLSFLHDKRHLRGPRRSPLGIHWCCPAHDTRKEGHARAVEGDGGQPLRSSHRIQKKRGGENRRGAGASSMPLDSPAPPPLINTVAPRACAALTVVCGSGGASPLPGGAGGLQSALALPTRPGQWFGQQPGPAATVAPSSNCLGVCGALAGRERRACPPRGRSGVVSPAGGPPRAQRPAFRKSLLGGPASRHSQAPTADSARCSTAGTAELPRCPARGRGLPSSLLDDRRG